MGKKFVSITTSGDPMPLALMPTAQKHTFVPFAVQRPTMLSPGPVDCAPHGQLTLINSNLFPTSPQILPYRDFSNTIVHRVPFTYTDILHSDDIFLRIVHPYSIDAFDHFLSKHDLSFFYPLLLSNLRHGFPLGEMPPLTDTVIFNNHPSALLYPDAVNNYLIEELAAGRMSGPFSLQHAENVLRGAILCSPLLVSIQTQQPGMPDKLRVCRHLSKGDKITSSMNSHILKEDFPTRFDTASRVADIVSFLPTDDGLYISSYLHGVYLWCPFLMGFTAREPYLRGFHISWPSHPCGPHLVAIYSGHISWPYYYLLQVTYRGLIILGSHIVA
jgi:hypothetical protein